jgi:membrane protein DedA with SNARE-associated domain
MPVFNQLVDAMSGAWWTYLLVAAVCLLDAVLPIVPSETMVITGGVLASRGDLNVVLIIVAGALGAFLGDNTAYGLGRRFGDAVIRLVIRGERGKRSLEWAKRMLDERGGTLIAVARFIPGGRTATTFTSGTTHFPYLRFLPAAAVGGVAWAAYNGLLGFAGGSTFKNQSWKGLLLAFGIAAVVTAIVEVVRWLRSRRRRSRQGQTAGRARPGPATPTR